MTKLRAPDSIEDAIVQAVALLGGGPLSIVLQVSESLIGKWSNPDDHAHRIGLHQALTIERLLIKTGHGPVFGELFRQLLPVETAGEEAFDPVRAAMHTTRDAAQLMDRVDQAMVDGALQPHEIIGLRSATAELQKKIAKFRRTLVAKPPPKKR